MGIKQMVIEHQSTIKPEMHIGLTWNQGSTNLLKRVNLFNRKWVYFSKYKIFTNWNGTYSYCKCLQWALFAIHHFCEIF